MLMIFIFSITPKKYLHDLVANHTDFYGYSSPIEKAIHAPGLDCDADDQVVTVPFNESIPAYSFEYNNSNTLNYSTTYKYLLASISATQDVRGPPRII
jgi:hypothetical protein